MNRTERRQLERRKKAISREFTRMEKPEQYHLGFTDGGKSMTEACYAAFISSLHDHGIDRDAIVHILRDMDDRVTFYAGDRELQAEAWDKAGVRVDFSEVFSEDRIAAKEAV